MAWTLADIRAKVRTLTSRPSANQISNDTIDSYINDFYRFDFCELVGLESFKSDWTQEATVTDSGEYTISEDVVNLEEPVFVNDEQITVYYDKDWFFSDYPDEEDYTTSPTLAIGSSDVKAVANSAFKYEISGWIYSKAAAETSFSGLSTVPQNKYGAFLVEIDSDGTVTISEADDNSTGYDTPALAVNDLPARTSGRAIMGYVTVISTDSGGFVPGTTELSDSAVTDTYTNGDPGLRSSPSAILLDLSAEKAYIRPKVFDTYLIKSKLTLQRPATLTSSDEPLNTKWGLALALGAAIKIIAANENDALKILKLKTGHEMPQAAAVLPAMPGSLDYEISNCRLKTLRQLKNKRVERTF
jgi:hypothetical protein